MIKKIRNKTGETIAETLIAMIIVTMALTMLAGAITESAKANKSVRDKLKSNTVDGSNIQTTGPTPANIQLSIDGAVDSTTTQEVNVYGVLDKEGKIKYSYYIVPSLPATSE